jgi:hypothetical protein
MRRVAILLAGLALPAGPVLAGEPAEKACAVAMAERLPQVAGLRVLQVTYRPAPIARSAGPGERRRVVDGHMQVDVGGIRATYAFSCSVLIDRRGIPRLEPDKSFLSLAS